LPLTTLTTAPVTSPARIVTPAAMLISARLAEFRCFLLSGALLREAALFMFIMLLHARGYYAITLPLLLMLRFA